MQISIPAPEPQEDWKDWAQRIVQGLRDAFTPISPAQTGQLGEFLVVPSGWVPTNGGNLEKAGFSALSQLLGTTFGAAPAGFVKLPNITSSHTGFTTAIKA